ncbi:MAG TPA: nucleoside triphosphate pyrophosphohydrolase family protein [Candidatus Saccharimonadales bacterium]
MTFEEYQKQAITTLISHPDPLMDKTIMVLGIAGESSEVAEKWKKLVAYRDGVITAEDKQELGKEIGDVLWYLTVFADMLGLSMDDIAKTNAAKLASRKVRGVQKGSGDNR